MWSTDNLYRCGELVPGHYVLLKDGHQVAQGLDAPELQTIANLLNMTTEEQRRAALHMLCGEAA